jgi:hypothetical protein
LLSVDEQLNVNGSRIFYAAAFSYVFTHKKQHIFGVKKKFNNALSLVCQAKQEREQKFIFNFLRMQFYICEREREKMYFLREEVREKFRKSVQLWSEKKNNNNCIIIILHYRHIAKASTCMKHILPAKRKLLFDLSLTCE